MKMKSIVALLAVSLMTVTMNVYAEESQPNNDESIVIGACMTVNIQKKVPGIAQDKIEKCSNGDAKDLPKCLGVSDADFLSFINACKAQLNNAKCVAGKLKVKLIQYADCGYEKDVEACYKNIGTSSDAVAKLSQQCIAEGAK